MAYHSRTLSLLIFVILLKHLTCDYPDKITSKKSRKSTAWREKDLIKVLLRDYDNRARPVVDKLTPLYVNSNNQSIQQITVEFGLSLIQIMELNEMDQIFTTNVRTLYRWTDYHMQWKPHLYDNITHVHIPTQYLWLPDISLYNYADERREERRTCDAIVKYDGTVEWHPMAIFKSTCPVRIKYFPFDRQCCKLKFGPWSYDGFRVNITFYDSRTILDQDNYVPNVEWELIGTRANFTAIKYPCCIEPYPDISFHILVKRNSAFYNYILILPCFLLSSLTLVLFWLPAESPAKMVLGMNIFIAFFFLVVLLEKSIPSASSSFPLIGTYYCINMTLITMSSFLCLITVNFHFRGDNRKEVPFWLKKLTLKHGARILMVDLGFILKTPPPEPVKTKPCTNPSFPNNSQPKNLPVSDYIEKTIPGAQFYDSYYQPSLKQRNQSVNIDYLQNNHLNVFESCEVKNSRPNTPDCAAAVSSVFDRYPVAESVSGNDDDFDEESDIQQQQQQQRSQTLNYFKDYEEDLEEFLTECIQSPLPNHLVSPWEGYNSGRDHTNSYKFCRDQDINLQLRSQLFDVKTGPVLDKSMSNKHSIAPINVFVARRINLVTKDISDIVKDLSFIQKNNENKDRVNKIVSEWRAVGLVLDRLFFILYVIAIILSLILFFPKAGEEPYKDADNNLNCDVIV